MPSLSAHGHGRGREVLHLLKMEVHTLGEHSQFGHVLSCTTRVATNKIGNDLLTEVLFTIDAIKDTLKLLELLKRRLAHDVQHCIGSVLGRHFEATAHMVCDKFLRIFLGRAIHGFIVATM